MNKASFRAAWRPLCVAYACFVLANTAHAAGAPNCKPLQLINSIKLATNADHSRYFVPVAINGVPKTLVLDTGGARTQLTDDVAKELNLPQSFGGEMRDLYGHTSYKMAHVTTFDLGSQRGKDLYIHIDPMPAEFAKVGGDAVGVLSTDLFQEYDIDMDFAALRLNYFSQDHCEGRVAYWPERPLAILPFHLRDGHITMDVTLDGKTFTAMLDTGAPTTTTGVTDVVEAFHFERDSPDLPVIQQNGKVPDVKI